MEKIIAFINKNFMDFSPITRKNKNQAIERERVLIVFVRKKYELNEINDIKFIQNKMGRRRIKI